MSNDVRLAGQPGPAGVPTAATVPSRPPAVPTGTAFAGERAQVDPALRRGRAQPVALDAQAGESMGQRAYDETHRTGLGGQARQHWQHVGDDALRAMAEGRQEVITGHLTVGAAALMRGAVRLSGLQEVPARWAQLQALHRSGASVSTQAMAGAKLTGEVVLAALPWIGLYGVARGVAVRQASRAAIVAAEAAAVERLGVAGAQVALGGGRAGVQAIRGMVPVSREAANVVTRDLHAVIRQLPRRGTVAEPQVRAFFGQLEQVAGKYGIRLQEGGGVGEAVGSARVLNVSLKAGAPHEMVHAVQMVQTRATAFVHEAQQLGVPVQALTAQQAERAYASTVRVFEDQAYRHFEQMAFQATGIGGAAQGGTYRRVLHEGVKAFSRGLQRAQVPQLQGTAAARAYGALTVLGRSQGQIGANLAALSAPIYQAALHDD